MLADVQPEGELAALSREAIRYDARMTRGIALLLLVAVGCATPRAAPEAPLGPFPLPLLAVASEEGEAGGGESSPELRKLLPAVFVGYTSERAGGGATIGVDVAYRYNEWFALGGFGEIIMKSDPAAAFGLGPYMRPIKGKDLVLVVAPGFEIEDHEVSFLTRLGGFYEIEYRKWTFAPAVYADIFRGKTAWVFGFNIGYDF